MTPARLTVSGASKAPPATLTLKIGPNPEAQPSSARAPRLFTIPKGRLDALWAEPRLPRFTKLLNAASAEARRAEALAAVEQERKSLVAALVSKAQFEGWSLRKLARKIQIPWTSFRRLIAGEIQADLFLPLLQSAAARLVGTEHNTEDVAA